MKISAILTVTNPNERQDPWEESLKSVLTWADEVIIVNGGRELSLELRSDEIGAQVSKIRDISFPWSEEWSWDQLPKALNRGLKIATGDWVIRVDADYVFEEACKTTLKERLESLMNFRVATFQKFSSVLWNKWYQKGAMVMAINKARFPDTVFGKAEQYTDLCLPIIDMGFNDNGVPLGRMISEEHVGKTRLNVFNYDYTFKTKEFTKKEFARFSRAHERYFKETKWGRTEEESFQKFIDMMKGRLKRCVYTYDIKDQPIFIHEKLKSITTEMFGHSGWGLLEDNDAKILG